MLAFHGAREKARDEIALNERVQKDERESDDDEDGKESSGICHIHPGILHGNESNGFVVAVSHHDKCQKEFVPCHDELPDGDEVNAGFTSGSATCRNICRVVHPSIIAASNRSRGESSMNALIMTIAYGMPRAA